MKPAHLVLSALGAAGWCLIGLALVPDPLVGSVAGLFGAWAGYMAGVEFERKT